MMEQREVRSGATLMDPPVVAGLDDDDDLSSSSGSSVDIETNGSVAEELSSPSSVAAINPLHHADNSVTDISNSPVSQV